MDFNLFTSSSCATTLRRRPPRLCDSELSSPLITRSITSLRSATLLLYAKTAPCGSSFLESNCTACRANSSAFVKALRDEGRLSDGGRGSGGDRSSRSGTISCVCTGERVLERSIERGGGSERLSVEEEAVSGGIGEILACLDCEKAATAAKLADADGRV